MTHTTDLVLPPQEASVDVLLEKYAEPGETSIDDVRRRVAQGLSTIEKTPEAQQQWAETFYTAQRDLGVVMGGRINAAAGLADTAATLINVDQLGHAWSGGAANQPYSDAQGPDASRLVWAFVSKQFPSARAPVAAQVPARLAALPAVNIPLLFNPFALFAMKGATLKP